MVSQSFLGSFLPSPPPAPPVTNVSGSVDQRNPYQHKKFILLQTPWKTAKWVGWAHRYKVSFILMKAKLNYNVQNWKGKPYLCSITQQICQMLSPSGEQHNKICLRTLGKFLEHILSAVLNTSGPFKTEDFTPVFHGLSTNTIILYDFKTQFCISFYEEG